jgi:carbon starvation protein
MSAMPVMLGILCVMAIAYRYYSAFIAARVAVLDDARVTAAHRLNDGQNYHPTNKWVLFGHHFAAISGAGPLIGPVLAAQFGYLPGLLWIVIGVCLGGAVQDFLVLVCSMRRNGRSLAQIAYDEIGRVGGTAAMAAILFIIVIALAGLGKVVVKALGGEAVKYPAGSVVYSSTSQLSGNQRSDGKWEYDIPEGATLRYDNGQKSLNLSKGMKIVAPAKLAMTPEAGGWTMPVAAGSQYIVPGSSWGTFTIACTIPIALFVGLYMYKIRKGHVVEASLIGAVLTLAATVFGGFVPGSPIEGWFNLRDTTVVWCMAAYGFVASVLPVWVLLCPRDYLSSFLKIGTIALLVGGTLIANPKLHAPAYNELFAKGNGPVVAGKIFPFLFITIMCGAISGFHALVSSGTTPKMISKESHARIIGYGSMMIEGLVGVVAMIAAATLPQGDYYAMNTELGKVPEYHDRFVQIGADVDHLNVYEDRTHESLRGRTGGAVTLAVGFAHIFDGALGRLAGGAQALWKYWYHFAIMFEALFILTTIDTGTRIGRFLLQEVFGKVHPKLGQTDWWPGAIISTLLIVVGWAWFINSNNFMVVWAMFGIGNQMLAVIALAIVTTVLVNEGKARYAWVTAGPMIVVMTTTGSAAMFMLAGHWQTCRTQFGKAGGPDTATVLNSMLQAALIVAMLVCAALVIAGGAARCLGTPRRFQRAGVELEVVGG